MSRLKGCAAAGLRILPKNPAYLTKFGRVPTLLVVGPLALFVIVNSLVGVSGSSVPVPPRKPEPASLIQNSGFMTAAYSPSKSNTALDGSYKSPFGGTEMDLYRDIFRLQAGGQMEEANQLIARLSDQSLRGHVLAQRYLHPSYKASFEELSQWLALYADHPEANRIARLANSRVPQNFVGRLTKVSYAPGRIEELSEHAALAKTYHPDIKRSADQNAQAKALISAIRRQIQQYEPSQALRQFNESPVSIYLDSVEKDRILALIASGYLYAGKTGEAERLSALALNGSQGFAPMAGWVHGLAKWRQGLHAQSASSFEIAAASPYATGTMAAAASYWAARAYQKSGHDRRAKQALERASAYPETFYGLLALQALGRSGELNWETPRLTAAQERELLATPAGQRAEKLLAAGEVTLAEAEIRSLYVSGDKDRKKALMAYAYTRRLPSLTMQLAHANGRNAPVPALYPAMPWSPNQGYRIDRALIHAITRQESRFNASAENKGSGATGLMQLMPLTANYVAGEDIFHDRKGKALLKSPEVSLDLGQQYIEYLLNNELVGQDLISLAIAYNAGPGRLSKWKAERADIDDPLLFIETIPFHETRAYVQRVMSNYWIYRMRFDQPNDSMQALAEGRWARYAAHDKGAVKFADAR